MRPKCPSHFNENGSNIRANCGRYVKYIPNTLTSCRQSLFLFFKYNDWIRPCRSIWASRVSVGLECTTLTVCLVLEPSRYLSSGTSTMSGGDLWPCASTICFGIRSVLVARLDMITRNTLHRVVSIIPGGRWVIEKFVPTGIESSWKIPVVHELTNTHVIVRGWSTFWRVTPMIAGRGVSGLHVANVWVTFTTCFGRCNIRTGEECQGTNFLSLHNIPWRYLSMMDVCIKIWTARLSKTPNQTRTPKPPSWTKRKMIPTSVMGFLVAVCRRGSSCLLIFFNYSFLTNTLLTRFSPSPVSWIHVFGCSCGELMQMLMAIL